jgi:hypothetical protein
MMDYYETVIEANRQIRLLMLDCADKELEQLNKRIRPIPTLPQRRHIEPLHISTLLPVVMTNIEKRMAEDGGLR